VPPPRSAGAHPCRDGREAATSPTVKPASGPRHEAPADHRDAATVTVLAVDDQPIFLRAAHQLIVDTPGFEQVGEATSGPEALEMAAALDPDLVLLDVRMPGMDGIETARRLVALDARAVVVLVSLEEAPELPASPATVGAAVHLRKQDLSTRALREIWKAHGGERVN
jgi:two-component system, NarL family, invasion response regulator UvrY